MANGDQVGPELASEIEKGFVDRMDLLTFRRGDRTAVVVGKHHPRHALEAWLTERRCDSDAYGKPAD